MTVKPSYACVHCGETQQQLYKSYGPDLLKLSRCSRCNRVVDEYIEMEFSIVLIDAVLQKLEAYRHIIFNVGMGRPWKIALLFLLGEALEHWMSRQQTHKAGYDLEWHFYIICLFLVASNAVFIAAVILLTRLSARCLCDWTLLARAVILGSYGKLLALPANLWGCDRFQSQLFLATFFLFSQVQACRAITGMGRLQTAAIVFASYSLQQSLSIWMSPFL
uniref:Protein ARV n=1 Tax=Rhipicephalus appendiculatus TaxID=34631 RepID=A0A131YND4_RHIAP